MTTSSDIFRCLSNIHRRRVLYSLLRNESIQVPQALLTRGLTENHQPQDGEQRPAVGVNTPPPTVSQQRLDIKLRHAHLPKLENEAIIEWDEDTGTVSRGPQFAEIEPILQLLIENASAFPDDLL